MNERPIPSAEIAFDKYKQQGPYHWDNCSNNIKKMNAFVLARYKIILQLLEEFKINELSIVLDSGCGDGALSGMIYKQFKPQVFGVDVAPESIEWARKKFQEHNFQGTFKRIPPYEFGFSENYFDFIVCADVIEHVLEPIKLLHEIKKILKPKGRLILSTPIRLTEKAHDRYHVQEWFQQEFETLCLCCFDKIEKKIYSHPVVWYELYVFSRGWLRTLMRRYINMRELKNKSVFSQKSHWRLYTMQTLTLTKEL